MADTKRHTTTANTPTNQWVRDALEHCGKTMQAVADAMNRENLPTKYDRSKIQKMTVGRRVKYEEAEALSRITGFPLNQHDDANDIIDDYRHLDAASKSLVRDLVQRLRKSGEAS